MSKTRPTRVFYLDVEESLIPFTSAPKKGFTSFQTPDGLYFNTRAYKPGSQQIRFQYAMMVKLQIEEIVAVEARKLQREWYQDIPKYFNRRAYGMYFNKRKYPRGRRPGKYTRQTGRFKRKRGMRPHIMEGPYIDGPKGSYLWDTQGRAIESKYTNQRQFPGRTHTGQLRRALVVADMSVRGCTLIVRPCYSENGGGIDYVAILMKGAKSKQGHPYIPELDRRIKMKLRVWRGIKATYWGNWQKFFMRKVDAANDRIHQKVMDLLLKLRILEQRDLGAIRRGSKKDRYITAEETKRKARKAKPTVIVTPDSPYNNSRNGIMTHVGSVKRDPQVYHNSGGYFNPFLPFQGQQTKKRK